jgi:glycosyltransferase involved in cell wall biosynthesis
MVHMDINTCKTLALCLTGQTWKVKRLKFERTPNLVSVVVPAYNAEKYIVECLEGIRLQTYPYLELIIIDDCSSDGTVAAIHSWISSICRDTLPVLFVPLPRNIGTAGAYTSGMFLTKGEFIAIQDCDDISLPERIEKQVDFLQRTPGIDMIGTRYKAFRDGDESEGPMSDWIAFGTQSIHEQYKNGLHCIANPTLMLRGTVFDTVGGHSRRVIGAEDYDFISRCILGFGMSADNLNHCLYRYRSHAAQHSRKFYS